MPKSSGWAPREKAGKKTSIGQGKRSKFKSLASNGIAPKGYRKKYRGQGKKR
jgi:hypothetical protein